ncbi:RNI-like protein [Sistotremastrum suecicum HHB10207 ss-3]|uniref:RNI-like protein n=1 Tax=Sistotremastrum suecicum HHB10207 ss-3 TaxID=1314776 RepID=A0A166AJD9_9AGAM|nr:RNI-like protein [Sistotremastrum suecicum HHB10207 ss-3]
MSKRNSKGTQPPAKRARKAPSIGAALESDGLRVPQLQDPTSSAFSIRTLPPDHVPALTTICARLFVAKLQFVFHDTRRRTTQRWLRRLPEPIITKIFAMLRQAHPALLSHPLIVEFFIQGDAITFSEEMTGVTKFTIVEVGRLKSQLTSLELIELKAADDRSVASVLDKCDRLEVVNLRGCVKVAEKSAASLAKCPNLRVLNISHTSVPPLAVVPILVSAKRLEVLKAASLPNFNDNMMQKIQTLLEQNLKDENIGEMPSLKTLKLKLNRISETYLLPLLRYLPNLETLDLSFTNITHMPVGLPNNPSPPLRKLNITSTVITGTQLVAALKPFRTLRKLSIGALGAGLGSSARMNSSAMVLTDANLRELTDILAECEDLAEVSLVSNIKLGVSSERALQNFVRKAGRKCTSLNLSNITALRSSVLCGLVPGELEEIGSEIDPPFTQSPLKTLLLNNTGVDDDAWRYISACQSLETLELAGTKFTEDGVFRIIDSCPILTKLDLTSCRGIKVTDRRRFFEVWEAQWKNK